MSAAEKLTPVAPGSMTRTLEPLVTLAELAAQAGVSRWTMRRRLRRLHARNPVGWLIQEGEGSHAPYRVNVSLLRHHHPQVFAAKVAGAADLEEMRTKMRDMNNRLNELRKAFRAASHAQLTRGASGSKVEQP